MTLTVAAANFAPDKGNVAGNLDRIAEAILQALGEGVELVVFPESATTGYILEGGVIEHAQTAESLMEALAERLKPLTRPIDVVVGFYEKAQGDLYNSAAYMEFAPSGPRLVHVYRKFFLPTYGVFDEERFVTRGREIGVFDTRLGRFAILICEDVWHSLMGALCAVRGAQMILVPAASPARGFESEKPGNLLRYERMLRAISEEHSLFTVNAMLCGFEGGKGFVGGSMVFDPMGKMLVQAPMAEEALVTAQVDLELITIARAKRPLLGDLMSVWSDIRRMVDEA